MDNLTEITWIPCESYSDMKTRIASLPGSKCFEIIQAEDSRSWGFFALRKPHSKTPVLLQPIGYADIGLPPEAVRFSNQLLIGVNEKIVVVDVTQGTETFTYRMPTIFHEFLSVNSSGILARDEIGFILLSWKGEERWRYCKDIIDSYKISGNKISFSTIEGEHFHVHFP